jgi:hypothetical protein
MTSFGFIEDEGLMPTALIGFPILSFSSHFESCSVVSKLQIVLFVLSKAYFLMIPSFWHGVSPLFLNQHKNTK